MLASGDPTEGGADTKEERASESIPAIAESAITTYTNVISMCISLGVLSRMWSLFSLLLTTLFAYYGLLFMPRMWVYIVFALLTLTLVPLVLGAMFLAVYYRRKKSLTLYNTLTTLCGYDSGLQLVGIALIIFCIYSIGPTVVPVDSVPGSPSSFSWSDFALMAAAFATFLLDIFTAISSTGIHHAMTILDKLR